MSDDLKPTAGDAARDLKADLAFQEEAFRNSMPLSLYGDYAQRGWPAAIRRALYAESLLARLKPTGRDCPECSRPLVRIEYALDSHCPECLGKECDEEQAKAERLESRVKELQERLAGAYDRVAAQSELLSRRAGTPPAAERLLAMLFRFVPRMEEERGCLFCEALPQPKAHEKGCPLAEVLGLPTKPDNPNPLPGQTLSSPDAPPPQKPPVSG